MEERRRRAMQHNHGFNSVSGPGDLGLFEARVLVFVAGHYSGERELINPYQSCARCRSGCALQIAYQLCPAQPPQQLQSSSWAVALDMNKKVLVKPIVVQNSGTFLSLSTGTVCGVLLLLGVSQNSCLGWICFVELPVFGV